MADFSVLSQDYNQVTIGPFSQESIGAELAMWTTAAASTAWPAANQAIFIPFCVYQPITVVKMGVVNGATANANLDAGIYDGQQNRIVSKGSTAQAGTGAVQTLDITDTDLNPGFYYMALNLDATTGTVLAWAPTLPLPGAFGVLSQSVGAVTLPATATFAASQSAFVPMFYLTARTLI